MLKLRACFVDPQEADGHACTWLVVVQYWKGDHIISVTQKIIEEHLRTISHQKNIEIDVSRLHWTPYPTQTGKK